MQRAESKGHRKNVVDLCKNALLQGSKWGFRLYVTITLSNTNHGEMARKVFSRLSHLSRWRIPSVLL